MARKKDDESFFSWFDGNVENGIAGITQKGFWDFINVILTPIIRAVLKEPEKMVALEIGYGGGRLLLPACNFFKYVIGVDIHNERDIVRNYLNVSGKTNFTLFKTDGKTLDCCADNSIDFIYSFIVFQHLPTFDVFEGYIKEIHRCLIPGGIAHIYYGSTKRLLPKDYNKDFEKKGFLELSDIPVNCTSLIVSQEKVVELCDQFKVISCGSTPSKKQEYITVVKKEV